MKKQLMRAAWALIVLFLLANCGPGAPSPVASQAPTETLGQAPSPTASQEPQPATAAPSDTPEALPSPTPTAEAASSTSEQEFRTYNNAAKGWSIDVPQDWEVIDRDPLPIIVFVAPSAGDSDAFYENVSLMVQDLDEATTLEEYTNQAIEQGQAQISKFGMLTSLATEMGGHPAQRVIYVGEQNGVSLQWMQVWTLVDNQAYILTYTTERDNFPALVGTVNQMLRSFQLP